MANAGLGEITPVKLQLSRENFNALIGRHSQPIRWLISEKCPCVQNNLKVDENCPLCKGNSVIYNNPTGSLRVESLKAPIDGVIDQTNIIWVRDFSGNDYPVTTQDCMAYVTGVKKGQVYQVKYTEEVNLSGSGIAEYIADKLYKIDIPTLVEFDTVQGSILSVSAVANGSPLTVSTIFRNCFEITDTILPADEVTVTYEYINPFKFALIQNNFTKTDQKFLSDIGGDGILIFPQRWEVYEKDIIVALNASQIKKTVFRSTGVIDTLPSFYPYELKSAYVLRAGVKYPFEPGVDFVLYSGNKIKWIGDAPTDKEQVSISYSYNVVYRVMSESPAPRTSEDNRFPRKVALKLVTDFNGREGF